MPNDLQMQLALSKYRKILRIRSGANCKSDEAAPRLTTLSALRLCWCVCTQRQLD